MGQLHQDGASPAEHDEPFADDAVPDAHAQAGPAGTRGRVQLDAAP
jgi:hypothetical protein